MHQFHFFGPTQIQIQVISPRNLLLETLIKSTVISGGMAPYDFSLLHLETSDFIAFNVMDRKIILPQLLAIQLTIVSLCAQTIFHALFHWQSLKSLSMLDTLKPLWTYIKIQMVHIYGFQTR